MTKLLKLPWSQLFADDELLTSHYLALGKSQSLVAMVWAAWLLGIAVAAGAASLSANRLLSQELAARASVPTDWAPCPKCHCRLRSKGMLPRQIQTLVGLVQFHRRVGRCRNGCKGVLIAPLDQELGLKSYQQTSQEVVQLGCAPSSVCALRDSNSSPGKTHWHSSECHKHLELGTVCGSKSDGTVRTRTRIISIGN